jgi:hypothetical protein
MIITGTYNLEVEDSWRLSELQEIYLECDTTLAPVTINLFPIADVERFWNVKIYISDVSNNAASNNIAINCDVVDSINYSGVTSTVISTDGGRGALFILSETQWGFSNLSPIPYTAYDTIEDEGTALPQRNIIDFIGNGVTASDDALNQKTLVNIPGGITQAYDTIQDHGVNMPQRNTLDFQGGGVVMSDNGSKTIATILSGNSFGLFAQTANSTPITATTAELTLIDGGLGSLSVPANGFNVGDSFRADFGGIVSAKNNDNLTVRVKSGSVILLDSGPQTFPTTNNSVWSLSLNFTIRQVGVATVASIISYANFLHIKQSNATSEGFGFNQLNNTTFDTTIPNTLNVTAQWSSNSPLNNIYSQYFTLSKIF